MTPFRPVQEIIKFAAKTTSIIALAGMIVGCGHNVDYYKKNPRAAHMKLTQCETLASRAIHSDDREALERLAASSECRAAIKASNTNFQVS